MTLLHTCWRDGCLYAWGEQEASGEPLPAAADTEAFSPFDAGPQRLGALLQQLLWEDPAGLGLAPLSLSLPTRRTAEGVCPVPSQPFLCGGGEGEPLSPESTFLHPWRVTAAALPWKAALLLLGLAQKRHLAENAFAGEDLLSLAVLFRYTGALVARGRFLPALRRVPPDIFEACWQPVLDTVERQRLLALAARIPRSAICGQPRARATETLLEELTDRLVRFSVITTLSRAQAEHGKHYSAHDAWFSALRGETRAVCWPLQEELEALRSGLNQWRFPVESAGADGKVLSFRLDAPESAEGMWFLSVRLSDGTRTTAVPAEAGTAADGACLNASLLVSLGQAALLFPPLGRAKHQAEGFGCALTLPEAHLFLTVTAAVLEAAGYRVLLPPLWLQGAASAPVLEADVRPQHPAEGLSPHTLDEKVAVSWSVTLNGERLTGEELEQLLQAPAPLVCFRGQWLQVDVRHIRDALRVWQRDTAETRTARDIVRLALGTADRQHGMDVVQVRGDGWLETFLGQLSGGQPFETLPIPEGFCGELRPYQIRGFSWLAFLRKWGLGACLADDMGLGKTIQTLAFFLHEKARGEKRPALLVGPMSVLGNWLHEAQRFAPNLRLLLHHGAGREHGKAFARAVQGADVVVTSYSLLHRDYADLRKVGWAGLVLDEAQNIKNPDTRQAQAARALQADYRIALTGTPIENHVGELWSIMDFLNSGLLGKRSAFRDTFFRPIQSGTDPGARTRLRRATAPFILRRLKTDRLIIADLPEKVEAKVYCPLTSEQARLYEEVLESSRRELESSEGIARRGLILAVLTRLKQVCNHPAHYLGQTRPLAKRSGKLARLEELLEEVFARGESALVFTQYAEMGKLLKRHLCQAFACDMPFLHGGVPRPERDRLVKAFQESSRPQAFILSLKAGGTGLNLTRASHVFHYDRWWNPAVENQATDRAFRIGQTHNVMVHTFICGGTLEDRIDAMIESKTALAEEIVTSGEAFLTELPDNELCDFLRLKGTVVTDGEEGRR